MKSIIAFDFDGTIIRSAAAREAQAEWYRVMSVLLNDDKVLQLAKRKDYFADVMLVMQRYTGLDNSKDRTVIVRLARNLFQLAFLGSACREKGNLVFPGMKPLLEKLRKMHTLALITTTPQDIVHPLLKLADCAVFDYVFGQPIDEMPSKLHLLERFVNNFEKPICYVGNSVEDIESCRLLKIPSILVTYDTSEKASPGYFASSVDELESMLKNFT